MCFRSMWGKPYPRPAPGFPTRAARPRLSRTRRSPRLALPGLAPTGKKPRPACHMISQVRDCCKKPIKQLPVHSPQSNTPANSPPPGPGRPGCLPRHVLKTKTPATSHARPPRGTRAGFQTLSRTLGPDFSPMPMQPLRKHIHPGPWCRRKSLKN